MRYIVVGEEAEARMISEAVVSVGEDELSVIVSGKGADLQLALSIAVAQHAPVALVRSAWSTNPEYIRERELGFQDFVWNLASAYTPVVFHGVPDIASSLQDEEWIGKLLDFATSDDYASRHPFEYRR
jgi:hypothetical protein